MATNGLSMSNSGDNFYASASPVSTELSKQQANNAPTHRRTYQACIPCRRRKVRCDLGEVDNPHDPPCNRCRRESKECFFSATRRKKKTSNDDNTGEDGVDDFEEVHTSRKRQRVSAPGNEDAIDEEDDYDEPPRTPGGSYGRSQPLRRPTQPKNVQYGEEDVKASEMTTAILQNHEVHGGHDALKLLYVAANQMRTRTPSSGTMARPNPKGITPSSVPSTVSPIIEKAGNTSYTSGPMNMFQGDPLWKTEIGPDSTKGNATDDVSVDLTADYATALKAWSRFRFVRAGWLTAKEAIDYILYFYKYLAPLTPIVLPNFRQPDSHKRLLEEEPMLAVTMLLIASRHMKLPGPGSLSRPYSLHDKFYKYLDGMIKRVVWGQEQFGGGFCGAGGGAGGMPGCDVNPLTRKGLRTMGTVESLLLLTEWHPRAMHFPPEEDDDELMVPDEPLVAPDLAETSDVLKGIGGHRMDAWLEPCWRSDRMCWMLTGMAMSLAFEIGVFDKTEWQRHARAVDGQPLSAKELAIYDQRRNNVKDVLLIYTTLTSGRIGLTSMLPSNYSKPEDSDLYNIEVLSPQASVPQVVLHFWLRIAAIMREGNTQIFRNKEFTRSLIRSGQYKDVLSRLQLPLQRWHQQLDQCKAIPQYMRYILEIEYEYARVYINAIALQAVVERCAKYPGNASANVVGTNLQEATSGMASNATISPATLAKWLEADRKNVLAVSDAARNLLKIIVEKIAPNQYLRHAPVRTYFRIISTAIVLLKTFSLGATESDVAESLTLMDRTVSALRNCVVDDVHVASRFADLLDLATQNLKPRLVRIAADGRAGRSRRASCQVTRSHSPSVEFATAGADTQPAQQGFARPSATPNGWRNNSNNSLMSPPSTMANSHPLYGIPDELYDLTSTDNPYSVMPPPGYFNSPNSTTNMSADPTVSGAGRDNSYTSYTTADDFMYPQDWLTLPLDSIVNMQGAEVEQSMFGPTFGSQGDMLEVMLHEQNGPSGFGGTNNGFNGNVNGFT